MFERVKEDMNMVRMRDPAARSTLEILLCYPGLFAIWFHRISQWFWNHNLLFLGRFISALARFFTGIEIHPGAAIGRRVFIDHGMGVVIGETAIVGDDVLIYQGVVLGGTSLERKKRHPTIKDGVVIGSGAKIIGNITIGTCSKIGAGSVVLRSIPPGATCVGIPGRVVQEERKCAIDLDHGELPDPVAEVINLLLKRQDEMEAQIKELGLTSEVMKTNGLLKRKSEMEEIFCEGSGI
ncbi:MAG: serine O-acetyltransferase [Methanobacteriaceae archaeon]|jgi:serine O-acetyltransferase|nr:serine O-acetyltransferase [Methanobacteriaceae archaeon]MDP2836006.1 serine O-acetyltransferase [Methanobacteriaceae archaeon]MDP3035780.1 serine O-acetyltransferase [Methanobacteriaceae archaeon]MDP3484077.1 serine O-acetyltransferase [Methanobacteriaceae archaeon]MDP3622830.1 serine O-acetyltransferase [Methanobacteriaceae archaeon]